MSDNKKAPLIIYQDEHLIVANKPSGLVIDHPTINENLRAILSRSLDQNLFIINRLDQAASGICLLARSSSVAGKLNAILMNGEIDKKYLAVVATGIALEKDSFETYIYRNARLKKAFVNLEKGKKAKLSYELICTSDRYDLLEVKIEHGRFHQIRCMLASKGMPIKGDVKYGFRRANKERFIHLHAKSLTFKHPYTGRIVSFSAPLPSETLWQFFAKSLRD